MRLLLDTHVWLWATMDPERLGISARGAIETETELVLSVASLWEMAIKQATGKLRIEGNLAGFRQTVSRMRGNELVIRPEHALAAAAALPQHHRDPFDRMLIAQANIEGLTLVTADETIRNYGCELLWAGS
jgi:PIN domain nuclease of toxin-antitoxin system